MAELFAHPRTDAEMRSTHGGVVRMAQGALYWSVDHRGPPLALCGNLRIGRHWVFRHLVARGKTSTG